MVNVRENRAKTRFNLQICPIGGSFAFNLELLSALLSGPPRCSVSQIGSQTYQNPNVVEACTTENRLETLENLSERLDATQKSLSNYLDTKRNSFPRFFFISDDELLSVLGSSDPTSIQVTGISDRIIGRIIP